MNSPMKSGKKGVRWLCIFCFWFLIFDFSFAATWLDPTLKWKTLETPHFSLHYYTELEDIAQRFAPLAEEIHAKLTPVLKHKPDLKTDVVLLDTSDYANGYATVFPNPTVTLYLTDMGSNLNPYKYDLWLKFVFLHEYTHILHLDTVEGGMELFKFLFGRIIFPNALEPWFLTEGMATYIETAYSQAGRGRDPRWEMMMRMDVLEENIKSLEQAAVDTVQWPMGHLRYLYGVKFLEYLAKTYGEDKLIDFSHQYGDFLLSSYGLEGAFITIFRKNSTQLWQDFLDDSRKKYKKQKEALGKIATPQLITDSGYYHLSPKWSKNGKEIYYQKRDASSYLQIRKINLETGKDEKILEGPIFDNKMSFSPDGRYLLFPKADRYKNFYWYKDLYLIDLETNKLIRLTEGLRAEDSAFSPDGSKIVFVRNEKGNRSLEVMRFLSGVDATPDGLRLTLDETNRVADQPVNVQYFSPSFSPDGKHLVAAKWTATGEQKIYLIDMTTGSEEAITDLQLTAYPPTERAGNLQPGTKEAIKEIVSEANPCFSPDGEYIFFDSDRTGIINLYTYQLKTKKIFQITKVLGGAMMPDVSPDGRRLAYVSYSSRGYDLAVMDVEPSGWKEVRSRVLGKDASLEIGSKKEDVGSTSNFQHLTSKLASSPLTQLPTSIHDYNPFPSLLPKFWLPLNYYNENGVQTYIYTGGTDALNQQQYQIQFGYDTLVGRTQYQATYLNDQFLPRIGVSAFDFAYPYAWNGTYYWERERGGELAFSFYQNRVFYEWDRQVVSLGYEQTDLSNISSIDSYTIKPSLGNINGLSLTWRYLSTRSYAKSISPEDGLDLSLKVTRYTKLVGSNFDFTNYRTSLSKFFPLPLLQHVFSPSISAFYSQGEQLVQSNFTWRYLSLRGYPSTHFSGNKGIKLSMEYRFPLIYIERGPLLGSTFFDRLWGDFFFDFGGAAFGSLSQLKLKRGFGAELNLDLSALWGYYALTLKFGYAKGLDGEGEEKFYFTLGS